MLLALLGVQPVVAGEQRLAEPEDAGERGAQLVGDDVVELVLEPLGLLQLADHGPLALVQLLEGALGLGPAVLVEPPVGQVGGGRGQDQQLADGRPRGHGLDQVSAAGQMPRDSSTADPSA